MRKGKLFVFILIILLFICVCFLQHNIESIKKAYPQFENLLYLPSGKFIKSAVLGFDELAADILYVKAIGYFGGHYLSDKEYKWFYHILDITTTLSPVFKDPYEFGAIALALEAGEIENSNQLLKKGIKNNPHYWRFPFYLGFNYFFYLGDYQAAAFYMERASRLPGAPAYLPSLASRLYAEAGRPEYAIEFLTQIYNQAEDEMIREEIKIKIGELIIERDLNLLEKTVKKYTQLYNQAPLNLEELVKSGLIENIPKEPFGGHYYIDKEIGMVRSSTHPERLRIYHHTKKFGVGVYR